MESFVMCLRGFLPALFYGYVLSGCSLVEINKENNSACHIEGVFGQLAYSADVENLFNTEDDLTYRLSNIELRWIDNGSLKTTVANIRKIRMMATKRVTDGGRPYHLIWSESHPVVANISLGSAPAKVATKTFVIPRYAFDEATHVGVTFDDDAGSWPVELELKQLNSLDNKMKNMCPGLLFDEDNVSNSLSS